ncbi:sulfite exporter TauE/SafE family protein [Paenibacillus thermotolerans]|uniref:sulfite exporter TauE/SafE family protein n=1 Tax=Paenibacillus thermotolerans TaxID=3027807 RepID=UPI0023675100|nr:MULTISPECIES: sulfite exporter TauE/SafE family protein [unclassified Paenibacillus]
MVAVWMILLLFIIGVVAAILGSIVGLGGGIIFVPALIYFGPSILGTEITPAVAVGTSLAVLIITALASTLTFHKQKRVDTKSGLLFFIASGPAAMLGSALTNRFSSDGFQLAFGFFMLAMGMLLIARDYLKPVPIRWRIQRTYTDAKGETHEYGYSLIPALICGAAVGFVSGLFGIGGGSLFVPLMVLLFRFPPHVATATSMFVILLSASLGTITKISLHEVNWLAAAVLAPGAWIGGRLGAWIAGRMSGPTLLWTLRVTLILMAIRLIVDGLS